MNDAAPSRPQNAAILAALTLLGAVCSAALIVLGPDGVRPPIEVAFSDAVSAAATGH